jgi:hypothetical protein
MTVRARFFVEDIQHHDVPGTEAYAVISMKPVFGSYGKPEDEAVNKSWSKWTPSGHISLSVTNPDAIDKFEKGKVYTIDIYPDD